MEDLKIPLREVEKRSSARKHVVLLTGASSFVAGHILQRLLANEIHVHATVRAPNDQKRTAFLRGLPNAETHLKLFKADLLKVGNSCWL
jgi:dihydroflavonol-4-reductase